MIACLPVILRICLCVWSSDFLPHFMCECVDLALGMCSGAMLMIACLSLIIVCLSMDAEQ